MSMQQEAGECLLFLASKKNDRQLPSKIKKLSFQYIVDLFHSNNRSVSTVKPNIWKNIKFFFF